jgi:hypothetical protein
LSEGVNKKLREINIDIRLINILAWKTSRKSLENFIINTTQHRQ